VAVVVAEVVADVEGATAAVARVVAVVAVVAVAVVVARVVAARAAALVVASPEEVETEGEDREGAQAAEEVVVAGMVEGVVSARRCTSRSPLPSRSQSRRWPRCRPLHKAAPTCAPSPRSSIVRPHSTSDAAHSRY